MRCFDGHQWLAPEGQVPGRQEDPRGEDQGFEFPSICFDSGGDLWLFGRPSHGFNAVCRHGSLWSDVYRFNMPGWGGRGQHLRCAADDMGLWTVRRDLNYIFAQRIEPRTSEQSPIELKPLEHADQAAEQVPAPPPGAYERRPQISTGEGYRIFFGDVHMHSSLSDGMGSFDEFYLRAREDYDLDFAVMTDHDDFVGNRILPSEWERMVAVSDLFNGTRAFTTLCGFEWTDPRMPNGDGHKNVYYRSAGPILWHTDPQVDDGPNLFARLGELHGICFPHHIGWTGVNWKTHDERHQPNVEICSVHGAYEFIGNLPIKHRGGMEGCFVRDGLGLGHAFGLVAGSDGHGLCWHHGISRRRNPWTHGLTGVLCREPSREAIWDALAERRCYATSGPAIALDFRVDGHVMGSEFTATEAPTVTAEVATPGALQSVAVVRDGRELFTSAGDGNTAQVRFVDSELPDVRPGRSYYYLRVVQRDGEMAWSSPVFVNSRPPATVGGRR